MLYLTKFISLQLDSLVKFGKRYFSSKPRKYVNYVLTPNDEKLLECAEEVLKEIKVKLLEFLSDPNNRCTFLALTIESNTSPNPFIRHFSLHMFNIHSTDIPDIIDFFYLETMKSLIKESNLPQGQEVIINSVKFSILHSLE